MEHTKVHLLHQSLQEQIEVPSKVESNEDQADKAPHQSSPKRKQMGLFQAGHSEYLRTNL